MLTDEQFTHLAGQYMDTVFRVAFSYMKNRDDAEDVTQNVLLKLYQTDTDFESESHVKHWLIRVTVNECKTVFRSPWRRVENIEDYADTLSLPGKPHRELLTLFASLPEKYRIVLYLYYYEDNTTKEIARLLDLKPATVRTRLARGREKLRKVFMEAEAI